jgi:predicted deacylase
VTVELRGERDVTHELAATDAEALVQYLVMRGLVEGVVPPLPGLACAATPLAGSMPLTAPHGGVLVHLVPVGSDVRRGQRVVEIVDPTGRTTSLEAPVDGVLYAREARRWIAAGTQVAKVAGREALRSGKLLSA